MERRRLTSSSLQAACLLMAVALSAEVSADGDAGAAPGSFRAAQELGLDFSLRPVDLLNTDAGAAPPGSFRAAQDLGTSDSWSRGYGDRWSADGYQGPGVPPPWAGGRDQPLDSRTRF